MNLYHSPSTSKNLLTHVATAAILFGNILPELENRDRQSVALCCKVWNEAMAIAIEEENQAINLQREYRAQLFAGMAPATFSTVRRLLLLDGDDGSVACRIYGEMTSGTFPRFSDNGTFEFATRSFMRLKNLIAVRGSKNSSMIGPADYFGNLEEPNKYLYVIDQKQFPPVFFRKPIVDKMEDDALNFLEFDDILVTAVNVKWIKGSDKKLITQKNTEYKISTKQQQRQSLFQNPGLLEIETDVIELNFFDPRGVDLSSFKARLVKNDTPFQITEKPLPSNDEYRLVSYLYEPGYTEMQVTNGSGLFLEKHEFSQTITPLNEDSHGFVALARTNMNPDVLELIGVEIPFGWTLIIHNGCIHGDTTLNGFFMMGMTSNHTTMRTADTVFLKCSESKANVNMVFSNKKTYGSPGYTSLCDSSPPYVLFQDATSEELTAFKCATQGMNFIFNPLSKAYWK